MNLTDEQREAIRARYPDHFFVRVEKGEERALIAIPKKHADKPIPSMPGMTVDLLHGATIRLKEAGT